MKKSSGFTLMELMIAVVILMVALTGLIATYVSCFDLNETARNLNYAMIAAQEKIEEIRNANFNDIMGYNNATFQISDFYPVGTSPIASGDSKGLVTVVQVNPNLLKVTIKVCWKQRGGRVIGGDSNLNPNDNSPAQLVTLIAER